jgi:hypothetical protein
MNWKKLLTSPPPTTCWSIDPAVVAAIRQDGKGMLHWAADPAPAGLFDVGPVGLQSLDRDALGASLGSVQGRIQGAGRAAVIVPTGWFRSFRLDFDELPRKAAELEQVVQWRLKKLLPIKPTELRISSVPLKPRDDLRPVVTVVGVDRAIAELEGAFADAGVELGLITTRMFALAHHAGGGCRLWVQQEQGFMSLLLNEETVPRFIRTKPLAGGAELTPTIVRELNLALRFVRDKLGVESDIELELSIESPEVESALEAWCAEQDRLRRATKADVPMFSQPGAAERLGPARTVPACRVLMEAAE